MKQKLIILSDLWGFSNTNWIENYLEILQSNFIVKCYDSCQLGAIDITNLTEAEIHTEFINNGIDTAVKNLISLEKESINILAFSIGGTIAWKAGLAGLKINDLHAISSTRLRLETEKPNCKIHLTYGENDKFKPNSEWFKKMDMECIIVKNGNHLCYSDEKYIHRVCKNINYKTS